MLLLLLLLLLLLFRLKMGRSGCRIFNEEEVCGSSSVIDRL
jgi:hypothetical protein